MKKLYYIAILVCSFTSLRAQILTGTVQTNKGIPVAAANVNILNTDKITIADKEGKFAFTNIPPGNYQMNINSLGFASQVKMVTVNGSSTSVTVVLEEAGKQLDEVVVSSDKTETKLQQTPLAVSSLSGQKLAEYRAWNIADLTALAPSLFVVEHGNSAGSNFFNIRGTMGFSNDQSVATYVDGVYQFDYYSAPINFNNIERIEILRGPQGTLYGRNAFSGVVNIITKKPTNQTSGYAEVDLGNYGQQRYTVGLNVPIVKNKLFFNVSGQYNGRGSVYSNPTLNTDHFDNHKTYNLNGNLKYVISDRWQVNVNAKTENNNDKGAYPWALSDTAVRNHPYQAFGTWDNTERRSNTNASAAVSHYGVHFNFTSITAGIAERGCFPGRYDADFSAPKFLSGKNSSRSRELTQEFRFSSPAAAGRLKWTAGSYLFAENIKSTYITYYDEDYALVDPLAPYEKPTYGERTNRGIAFFGQATYSLTSKLDITAGTRYDTERRERTESTDSIRNGVTTQLTGQEAEQKTFHAFTPKVIMSYKLTGHSLLYASYARGFRLGGFNIGASGVSYPIYKPETSDNYEAAIKNTLFGDRLKLNVTVFYLQQKDQQVGTTVDGVNYLNLNVGDMNNFGVETEVAAIPLKNLSVEWNGSWSDAKYAKLDLYDATDFETKNYKGNRPINNPELSSMLAVQYSHPFVHSKQNLSVFVRGEYRYIGKYYLDFLNTDYQPGYNLFNARAGIAAKNFEVAAWGRNINDVRYVAYGYGTYLLGNPRMWGVTVTGKF